MTPTQSEGSPGVMLTKTPSSDAYRRPELDTVSASGHGKMAVHVLTIQLEAVVSGMTGGSVGYRDEACRG
jgi:hypothetical protein